MKPLGPENPAALPLARQRAPSEKYAPGDGPRIELVPLTWREAVAFVRRVHRHHAPPRGAKATIGASVGGEIVGAAILGRPVARGLDDGWTCEMTRVAGDGTKNVSSFLYGAGARLARSLGYRRCVTYTLQSESGASLRAAGWRVVYEIRGRSWNCASRPRVDATPVQTEDKTLWEAPLR